jgi:uncharacterized protein YciI
MRPAIQFVSRALSVFLAGWLLSAAGAEPPRYFVAFLNKGPRFGALPADSPERKAQSEQHVAYIEAMMASGKMVAFGPILEAGDLRGMYIFKAASIEEARALADREPSVKTGYTVMRVYPWLGSANLGVVTRPDPSR